MSRPTIPLDNYPDRELIEDEDDYYEGEYENEEEEIGTERVPMNCWEFLNDNLIWILLLLSSFLWWLR